MRRKLVYDPLNRIDLIPAAFIVGFALLFSILPYFYGGRDLWRHAGVIASFTRSFLAPEHETLSQASHELELHTPLHFALALVTRLAHLTPLGALRLSGLMNVVVFLAGTLVFCRRLVASNSEALWAAATMIFLMLFGHWASIGWSGETSFATLPYIVPQPSFLCLGLMLLAYGLVEELLDAKARDKKRLTIFATLLSFLLLTHAPSALCLVLQVAVQTLYRRNRSLALRMAAIGLSGVALAFVWPYIHLWNWLRIGGTRGQFEEPVFRGALPYLGPALLFGLPAFCWLVVKRLEGLLLVLTTAALCVFALGLAFHVQTLARFLFFSAIYLDALTAVTLIRGRYVPWLFGSLIALALTLCIASPENERTLPATLRVLRKGLSQRIAYDAIVENHLAMLVHQLGPGDVVILSDVDVGEADRLATFTGAKVIFSRYAQTNSRYDERRSDAEMFLTSEDEETQHRILEKYGVTALVFLRSDLNSKPHIERLARALGRPTDESHFYLFYRLAPRPSA